MAWFRRPLTVVKLLINAASAAQDVLAEQNGVDVVGGNRRNLENRHLLCHQYTGYRNSK